jgi:peroxiredoxin
MLKNEFKDKDVEIIGISVDALTRGGATAADVIPFMNAYKINYPILRGDGNVIDAFGGITTIPTSFLINKEGKVVAKYESVVSKQTYVDAINKVLINNYDVPNLGLTPSFTLPLIKSE